MEVVLPLAYLGVYVEQCVVIDTSRRMLHTSYGLRPQQPEEGVMASVALQVLSMPRDSIVHCKHQVKHFALQETKQAEHRCHSPVLIVRQRSLSLPISSHICIPTLVKSPSLVPSIVRQSSFNCHTSRGICVPTLVKSPSLVPIVRQSSLSLPI